MEAGGKAWKWPTRSGRPEEEGAKASPQGRNLSPTSRMGPAGCHTSENESDLSRPLTKVKMSPSCRLQG